MNLQRYTQGDIDYLAKLNANAEATEAAVNGLLASMGGAAGPVNILNALNALFTLGENRLIGAGSYSSAGSNSNTRVTVQPGFFWSADLGLVLSSEAVTVLNPAGFASGTLYVVPDASGVPVLSESDDGAAYRFTWSGSAVSAVTREVAVTWAAEDWAGAQESQARGETFETPDARFEATETDVEDLANRVAATESDVEDLKGRAIFVAAPESASGALALDASIGYHDVVLDENTSISITAVPASTGARMDIMLTQDATGNRTVTWPANVDWPGGAAPVLSTAAGASDWVTLVSVGPGSPWRGRYDLNVS